jgi:hypothetical protein
MPDSEWEKLFREQKRLAKEQDRLYLQRAE